MFADIKAVFERDPAARNILEVLTYPGLHAICWHRLAHRLWSWRVPFVPRLISQFVRLLTGIEMHPGAQIGSSFFVDHGMGVVIGETSIIGDNCTLYQGVTLGGTGKERGKRHPTLGNNVTVSTGAKVLGNVTIGDNVKIGANSVVIRSVPPDCTVVGVPGRVVRRAGKKVGVISLDHSNLPDPLLDTIHKLQSEVSELQRHLEEMRKERDSDGV